MKVIRDDSVGSKKEQQLRWAIEEYKVRIKEAKNVSYYQDVQQLKSRWEHRQKMAGINKKDAALLLAKAARKISEDKYE